MSFERLVLVILDGWGHAPAWGGNAIALAKTPFLNELASRQTMALLDAAGTAVGLEAGQDGNSEVGHLHIGAGRIIPQPLRVISDWIHHGQFDSQPTLVEFLGNAAASGRPLHLIGLLSRATVHSNVTHLKALLEAAKLARIPDVVLHLFLDGRDSDPKDGLTQIAHLESYLATLGTGRIRTLVGRSFAMDRNRHWELTKQAYDLLVFGNGQRAGRAQLAVSSAYARGETDEFLTPVVVGEDAEGDLIGPNDRLIFWNSRPDRMRQLVSALSSTEFHAFDRGSFTPSISTLKVASLTSYDSPLFRLDRVHPLFPTPLVPKTLAELVSNHQFRQFHIAETEKYAHVTYFFNGRQEAPFPGEGRLLIPSSEVASYDLAPQMKAREITDAILRHLRNRSINLIVANYANADMIGHTGNLQATVTAVETIDQELARIAKAIKDKPIPLLITADHGNAEEMVNPATGEPATRHTAHPVPCYLVIPGNPPIVRPKGSLIDVAPTSLQLLGIQKPAEMTGQSLLG